ncbi:MAG: Rne/Rng family ribonuclease [Candidatus Tectomicrobia bacterium]|nr:Rne/Rng family ribonuclease [Candidatus Tectomicrobia bacterium]
MSSQLIINVEPQETRVALLENNVVTELYIERKQDEGIVGNIYKGKVTKVLPGMQAAFVDIGLDRAGFLYVSDVDAGRSNLDSFLDQGEDLEIEFERRERSRRTPSKPIEDLLRAGQEVMVQVTKEPIGTKGCRLTSYISLPGRYLVYMPTVDQIGVSRRIEEEGERKRLKKLIRRLRQDGGGYIVRTVSEGVSEAEFESDIRFLTTLWGRTREEVERASAPALIHDELNLVLRMVRDMFTEDIERMVIDDPEVFRETLEFVQSFYPHLAPRIAQHEGREPIFDACGVELEIERALGRRVWLKSGGYIVIDQTEALVSIDVNTGRFVGKRDPEETILKTNLEAVREIVYQIRLRNIGGIIILDFIDMEREENKEKVFEALAQELRADRSRTKILKISEMGLVEMTRKRVRESLSRILCQPCPYCDGRGIIKSTKTVCYEILREIRRVRSHDLKADKLKVNAHPSVAGLLLEDESAHLERIERELGVKVVVKADKDLHQEGFEVLPL